MSTEALLQSSTNIQSFLCLIQALGPIGHASG